VAVAALMNLIGAFLSIKVATTIATGIVDAKALTLTMVFAALIGTIAWNLVTWALSLPSSSSHALVGGVVGAAIAAIGTGAVKGDTLVEKVIVPAILSPVIAGLVAIAGTAFAYVMVARLRQGDARRGYRVGAQAREGDVVSRGASVLLAALGGVLCAAALIVGFIALTKK
jgi:inorganic phosphate transporter, PiT family